MHHVHVALRYTITYQHKFKFCGHGGKSNLELNSTFRNFSLWALPVSNPGYTPLPGEANPIGSPVTRRRPICLYLAVVSDLLALDLFVVLIGYRGSDNVQVHGNESGSLAASSGQPEIVRPLSRGPVAGVSEKANGHFADVGRLRSFPWNNSMLSWQRTAFHFQPEKNWMNDHRYPYKGGRRGLATWYGTSRWYK
ncbi:hypothetical protein SLEP1_g44849 [Rubroshorea leprosula]|uniref:beta-fructofuranosidase n=1 Tax=Rubroshorea leprosula TaxID=152421 RepID=A0AAV5LHA5_9ROSI|nr:hypothetical protein SLEP1_g44849 [Rubroshorea leprosula]